MSNQNGLAVRPQSMALDRANVLPSVSEMQVLGDLAATLIPTGFLPADIKNAGQAVAIMLKGRELGVPPMYALSNIVIVKGKPTVSAEMMLALIHRDHGQRAMRVKESSDALCTVEYRQAGWSDVLSYSYSIDMATKAGLLSNHAWKSYPAAMLRARCISAVARMAFPESIAGMYTPGELGEEVLVTEDGEVQSIIVAEAAPVAEPIRHEDEPPKSERDRANGEFFALVAEHGLTDDERHAIQRIAYGVDSANDLDAKQLRSLSKLLREHSASDIRAKIAKQAELDAQADAEAANHDPTSPIPDYLAKIRAATSGDALTKITQEMQAVGVWAPEVTAAIAEKRNELGLAAPKATATKTQLIGVPMDGQPGEDRFTN